MDEVEELLVKCKWQPNCLRLSIAEQKDMCVSGKSGKFEVANVQSNMIQEPERDLKVAINLIAPEWWDDETQVILNENVMCKRHKDSNVGHSWVTWFGDYTGGALCFEDGTRLEQPYVWHKIDGHIPHWSEPHTGTKYGVVLYRSGVKKTKVQNIVGVLRKVRHKKAIAESDSDVLAKEFLELLAKAVERGTSDNVDDWTGQIKQKLLQIDEERFQEERAQADASKSCSELAGSHNTVQEEDVSQIETD